MSSTNDIPQQLGTAHMTVDLCPPMVRAINGYPSYAVSFGEFGGLRIHVTPEQWDAIDAAVRSGFAAAQQVAS